MKCVSLSSFSNAQILLDRDLHHNDGGGFNPSGVERQTDTHQESHIAGYGSCEYCTCPAFTESYNDSYRCTCGHGWDNHYSAGALLPRSRRGNMAINNTAVV